MDCMKIGALTAHAAMIDGMIDRVQAFLKLPDVKVAATGGRAEDITALCIHKIFCDRNLLFHGLYELYQRNAASSDIIEESVVL